MKQQTEKQPIRSLPQNICSLGMVVLLLCTLFIGLFLAYYSLRYSYYSTVQYAGPVVLIKDNTFANLAVFTGAVLVSWLLQRTFDKYIQNQRLAGYIFLGLCCLIYAVTALVWVNALPYYPSGDQLNTTAAAFYHLDGNFSMLTEGGYLGKFPYQKGLTFFYEILFTLFGDFCYPIAAKTHIIMGIITFIAGYLLVEETSWNNIGKIIYCPLFLCCVPYLILTPYAYGDLPSICFCTILFLALLRFARTNLWRYIPLACVSAALALLFRLHTWIVLIAVIIGLVLCALQKKKLAPILAGILIITSAVGASKALDYSYYLRSGIPNTQGLPMILSLAMGMQDNYGGPGAYNNYQTTVMSSVNFDRDAATEIAKENLRENFEHFANDPAYAKWFFKTKLTMQWTEPSFEALLSTHSFDEELPMPQWIWDIYYGDSHNPILNFADRYQSLIYFGYLFFVPVLWRKRKENAASYIPLIAIVGGFLFSIVWEAQCRYVLPYYMFMLLYVPDGILYVQQTICKLILRIRNPKCTP